MSETLEQIPPQTPSKLISWLIDFFIYGFVFLILISLLLPLLSSRGPKRFNLSRSRLQMFNAALERYQMDFNSFPPDNLPNKDGSEILSKFLCEKLSVRDMHYGPYIENVSEPELISPLGGRYSYRILDGDEKTGPRALVIDPGKDNLLGGTIDPKKGFVPDGSGADKDNLYSIDLNEK